MCHLFHVAISGKVITGGVVTDTICHRLNQYRPTFLNGDSGESERGLESKI